MNAMLRRGAMAVLITALGACATARAEPYLGVREGLKCGVCHVNTSGGGLRTPFGTAYAQTQLAARRIDADAAQTWMGMITGPLSLGADLRASATVTDIPDQDTQSELQTEELRLYLAMQLVPNRLLLYADQRLAPGGSNNLEAYARLSTADARWQLKAGQMYLPYGLRLEDDTAFIRQAPGINFATPDNAVELGFETGSWTSQLALSNGTAGGPEQDEGKQISLRVARVRPRWRLGASASFNDAEAGDRRMQNLFAGLRTGPLAWLAELDYIVDEGFAGGERDQLAGLLETNWAWRKGQNLKLTAEWLDPDDEVDEDEQTRYSLVWEYTPFQFVQSRVGLRVYDGIPQNDLQNRRLLFWQLHTFF